MNERTDPSVGPVGFNKTRIPGCHHEGIYTFAREYVKSFYLCAFTIIMLQHIRVAMFQIIMGKKQSRDMVWYGTTIMILPKIESKKQQYPAYSVLHIIYCFLLHDVIRQSVVSLQCDVIRPNPFSAIDSVTDTLFTLPYISFCHVDYERGVQEQARKEEQVERNRATNWNREDTSKERKQSNHPTTHPPKVNHGCQYNNYYDYDNEW